MTNIQTMKRLTDIGFSLDEAKAMTMALSGHRREADIVRMRADLVYSRDLIERVIDDEGPSDELMAELVEFRDQGASHEDTGQTSRVSELEARCREHREKRAELQTRVDKLSALHDRWQTTISALRRAIEPLLEALGWPVPSDWSLPVHAQAAIEEMIRRHDVLLSHLYHERGCTYHETGVQDPDCGTCTDGELGPIIFNEVKPDAH